MGYGFGQGAGRGMGGPRGMGGRFGGETEGTLAAARTGDDLVVVSVQDDCARASAIRFGLDVGANVQCVTRIPSGPVVVRCGRQEIAVGRGLSRRIMVRPAESLA